MRSREKHAAYMRKYRKKNRDKINARRREKIAELSPDEQERRRELSRIRNRRYYDKNKERINARSKSKNWNYDPERRKDIRARYYDRYPVRNVLRARKCYAKKHGLVWNLNEEWYNEEFERGCAVTGFPFDYHRSKTPWAPHIDRIIPENGYTKDNCRLVCACYNQAKSDWTDDVVQAMALALVTRVNFADTGEL